MMTAYIVITLMSLLFPTSNQPDVLRYVSWNEFYHHMLAKGGCRSKLVATGTVVVLVTYYYLRSTSTKLVELKFY
uniref:Secreted protein n=1 Tax=Ixodes ricinus TaxID=34613 RepID=V5H083_IXORI